MKCTRCHCAIRPVVAIDIDGTLGDYHGHFIEFAAAYLNMPPAYGYNGRNEMHEHMGIDLMLYREVKLAYRQGGQKRLMNLFPGVATVIMAAKSWDCEVWLTTTRPYNRFDSTDPDTRHWLDKYHIPYDHLLYHEEKYERLAKLIDPDRVVSVIDDLVPQLQSAARMFGFRVPFQHQTQYNSRQVWNGYGGDLTVAAEHIQNQARDWRRVNA